MSFWLNILEEFIRRILQIVTFGRRSITNPLSIYVKTNTGKTISVNLQPKWDIKSVKELIAPQLGLQPDEVKIIFAGKELSDTTIVEECDLGQKSVLHAIRIHLQEENEQMYSMVSEEVIIGDSPSKPLCETLVDLQLQSEERTNIKEENRERSKAHFFVYCGHCKKLCKGKLRVRCSLCKGGAFTVHRDPECWDDVLKPKRITGHCNGHDDMACVGGSPFAEFYFKCGEHVSHGETDFAVPLSLIKINIKNIPCLACTDVCEIVLVFPCDSKHVTCIDCFLHYCRSRLLERRFIFNSDIGYTLACPAGCLNSYIEETHHFKLLSKNEYERYQKFATEEYVLQAGGVLCPQAGCGMGLIVGPECRKVTCKNGCGFVFCRNCLQPYHLGECVLEHLNGNPGASRMYTIDMNRAANACWDEASKATIKASTKPCPKCRTPTEKNGGCMHMVCTRAGCGLEWCWVCQAEWTTDCMGAHWFG